MHDGKAMVIMGGSITLVLFVEVDNIEKVRRGCVMG